DRRPGMQDHVIGKIRNRLRGRHHVDQGRLAGKQAPQHFLIGLFDFLQRLAFRRCLNPLVPAQAGTQGYTMSWMPACAGMSGGCGNSITRQPRSLSRRLARWALPPAGGLHCTCTTSVPWLARFTANSSSPILTTRGAAASKLLGSVFSMVVLVAPGPSLVSPMSVPVSSARARIRA